VKNNPEKKTVIKFSMIVGDFGSNLDHVEGTRDAPHQTSNKRTG